MNLRRVTEKVFKHNTHNINCFNNAIAIAIEVWLSLGERKLQLLHSSETEPEIVWRGTISFLLFVLHSS